MDHPRALEGVISTATPVVAIGWCLLDILHHVHALQDTAKDLSLATMGPNELSPGPVVNIMFVCLPRQSKLEVNGSCEADCLPNSDNPPLPFPYPSAFTREK